MRHLPSWEQPDHKKVQWVAVNVASRAAAILPPPPPTFFRGVGKYCPFLRKLLLFCENEKKSLIAPFLFTWPPHQKHNFLGWPEGTMIYLFRIQSISTKDKIMSGKKVNVKSNKLKIVYI